MGRRVPFDSWSLTEQVVQVERNQAPLKIKFS